MKASDLAEYLDHNPFLDQAPPSKPTRAAETMRDQHASDVLRLVLEVFPGARWTTREEYRRRADQRDRQGRRNRHGRRR
jgi:hypothetical protein